MDHDTLHDALIEAVKACGGSKRVAALLWPAKAGQNIEAARRYLANTLNPECSEKLALDEVMLILRAAREAGCHAVMQYLAHELSYAPPVARQPLDEADDLRRRFIAASTALAAMAPAHRDAGADAMRAEDGSRLGHAPGTRLDGIASLDDVRGRSHKAWSQVDGKVVSLTRLMEAMA